MRTGFEQAGLLHIATPLGEHDLLLDALEGSEGLGELFRFRLELRSGRTDLPAGKLVGQPAQVRIGARGWPVRHLAGIVSRFVHTGSNLDFASYEIELVPRLWLLTLSRGRRIWQNKPVDAIVTSVLDDFGIAHALRLSRSYAPREYCVQYDESAFDFIARLMERAGIFWFFEHGESGHTLVLGDAAAAFHACEGAASVRYFPPPHESRPGMDTVWRFASERAVVLRDVAVGDHDFEQPATSLLARHAGAGGHGEAYEFGTGHRSPQEGEALARLRVEASQAEAEVLRGDSFAWPFAAGGRFTLGGHFASALNTDWVLRRVRHEARDGRYSNSFEAFPAATVFRPPMRTPRPRVAGCETARVVGPAGEELWTDKHGRIKVQFPWDREGKNDEKSSTWLRVAQSVAGPGFGALFLPRIGQEVVVSYLHGDPDRPLVTGCVYNGDNVPPATLPADQTQTVLRTRSSKQGTAGNELRFEDRKDAEELYLHAQKDMRVEIENQLSTTVRKGPELHVLEEGDRTLQVKKGREQHSVQGTREMKVTGDETHTNEAGFVHRVAKNYELSIDGDLTIAVSGALTIKAGKTGLVKAGTSLRLESGTDLGIQAGTKLKQQAAVQIDHQAPIVNSKADATHTVQAGAMLTLKGAMTKVN